MSKFLSGRQSNLNLGVAGYTENKTVLETTGKVGIGTTDAQSYSLSVVGPTNITGDTTVGSAITMYASTGIVSATAFYGDGSNLENTGATLSAAAGTQRLVVTSLISGTMVDAATDSDLTYNATTDTLNVDNLIVAGNLTVDGDQTILNVTQLEVEDINIGIASASTKLNDAQLDGAGITIHGSQGDKTLTWDNSNSRLGFNTDVYAPRFYGDGSNLTNTGATLNAAAGTQRLVLTSLTSGTMVNAATDSDLSYDALNDRLIVSNIDISGIATLGGPVTAGTSEGVIGQYLRHVGTGVTWESFPQLRTTQTNVATDGQTVFNFDYNANFLDVFVNGIKLTGSEYTAVNGTSITLASPAFLGDLVEFHSYRTISANSDFIPSLLGDLTDVTITGPVQGESLVYDGGKWINDSVSTTSGTSLVVKDNGTLVGTIGTIDFGTNLSVSAASAGVVTVTASGGSNVAVGGTWAIDTVGINTSKNVGIGTTAKDGYKLYVEGDARVTGILTVGPASVTIDGINNTVTANSFVGSVSGSGNSVSCTTVSVGGSVTANKFYGDGSSLTGVSAGGGSISISTEAPSSPDSGDLWYSPDHARTFIYYDESVAGYGTDAYWIDAAPFTGGGGGGTSSGITTANINAETLNVSGVSTFNNNVTVDGGDVTFTSQGDKLKFTADAANPSSGGAIEISTSGSGTAEISGNSNQLRIYNQQDANHSIAMRAGEYYFQDESADYYALFSSGAVKLYHPDSAGGINDQKFETTASGIDVTGHTETDTLRVSGVSTFSGDIKTDGSNIVLGLSGGASDDRIKLSTSEIYQDTSGFRIIGNTGGISLRANGTNAWSNAAGNEDYIVAIQNAQVQLYYDNSKKFETTPNGVNVTGSVSNTGTGTTSYLRNVTLESYSEKLVDAGTVGSTYTYTLADGNYFKVGLGQTCTFTFDASNAPSQVYSFVIQLKNGTGGPFSITWPASVEWPAGVTPTRTTTDGRTDIWSFITTDGGTNWLGNLNIVNYNV